MVLCNAFVQSVDVQVTGNMMLSYICEVGKLGYSMVWCSAFVLDVDVQVRREDDDVTGVVGKIGYSMVGCSAFFRV